LKVSRTVETGTARSESRVPTAPSVVEPGAEPTTTEPQQRSGGIQPMWILGGILLIVAAGGAVHLLGGLKLGPSAGAPDGVAVGGQWRWDAGEEGTASWMLSQRGREITGLYTWDERPHPTEVKGEVSAAGVITLREATARAGAERARFEGRLQADGAIVGEQIFEKWRNPWRLERALAEPTIVQFGGPSTNRSPQQPANPAPQPDPAPPIAAAVSPAAGDVATSTQGGAATSAAEREASDRAAAEASRLEAEHGAAVAARSRRSAAPAVGRATGWR